MPYALRPSTDDRNHEVYHTLRQAHSRGSSREPEKNLWSTFMFFKPKLTLTGRYRGKMLIYKTVSEWRMLSVEAATHGFEFERKRRRVGGRGWVRRNGLYSVLHTGCSPRHVRV